MTEGTIWKSIVAFAIPLFLGNLFQQLYNMADSLIVGNFLGSNALAAVSSSGNLIFLLVGFFNGIAVGAGMDVLWLILAKSATGIYEIVPGFFAGLLAAWLVSALDKKGPGAQVEALFDEASKPGL